MSTLAEALAPKSDQLNAADLIAGPRIIKITDARVAKDGRDTKLILNYEGDNGKPWKPCKTMARAMVMAWAITENNEKQMIGKSVRVYRDPTVTFGADGEVGGIRASHMSHIDKPVSAKLMVSKGKYQLFTFAPLPTGVATGLDIEGALERLNDAGNLEALKVAWSAKDMRPFRDALQPDLDRRKAELSGEGRAPEDHGESNATDADALIAQFNAANDQASYDAAKKAFVVLSASLSDDERDAVDAAGDEAAARCLA